ncbi:general stress protein [Pseudofrankia sp. DC12]|uniref:general stress protein n=1 Tax=Pseudofrankia sp. DC12 TaxID=683315 RepID=UPI0006986223|nr:general stress protein [Pseudofrankia sp. DC12]
MGWREILGLPTDRRTTGRAGDSSGGWRAGPRGAGGTGWGNGREHASGPVFRPGDVDESPDRGPASHGTLDEPAGRPARPGRRAEPVRTAGPAEGFRDPAAPVRSAGPTEWAGRSAGDRELADGREPARGREPGGPGDLSAAERPVARSGGVPASGRELAWRFPPQQVVASYETHGQAARAVDHLADQRFPVERTAIVGRGLTSVESIGRMSWRDSTLRTVGGWALAGALLGWLLGLLDWASPLRAAFSLALWGLLFGGVLGLAGGLLARAFYGGGHPSRVTHSQTYRADSYDLLVDTEVAERARSTLALGGFPVTGAVRQDAAVSGGLRVGDPNEPGRAGASRRS